MTTPAPCMRCGMLSTRLAMVGRLHLCPPCAIAVTMAAPCGAFHRSMRAVDDQGTWACLACGGCVTSIPINTEPVLAEQAPAPAWED